MVKGRLKCIGSPQHLKAKFGDGYTLEVKAQQSHADRVHAFVQEQLPGSEIVERFGGHSLYRVAMQDTDLSKVRVTRQGEADEAWRETEPFRQRKTDHRAGEHGNVYCMGAEKRGETVRRAS